MALRARSPAAHRFATRLAFGRAWLGPRATALPFLAALPFVAVLPTTARAVVVPAELVARAGDVPVGAVVALASTQPPFVLADGGVAFTGLLADGDAYVFIRDQVVWQGTNEMMSILLGTEASMGATAAGGFVYGPEVDGAEAVWTHNGLLALEGMPAPAYPMGYVTTFHSRPTMIEDGSAWWLAGLNETGGTITQQRVLYRSPSASPADIQVELATGDMVGGLAIASPAGLDFDYHVSNDGLHFVMVVVMATGSSVNDEHVYVDGALFHQENTPNGTGDNWDNFDLVAIDDQGTYVFTGDTNGDPATDEFVAVNGAIAVREGDVLDGITLTSSASLRFVSLDDTGRLAHAWAYAGNSVETVFFACDAADVSGSSLAVLTAGVDELDLDGDGLGDGLVTDLTATSTSGSRALTDDGNLYLEVDLDEGAGPVPAMVRLPLTCCGNGMLDDGEACDDGNPDDTDACPTTCTNATCGDGFTWAGVEECDDADMTNTDACVLGCIAATCGDGYLRAGVEACDDGNGNDADGCPGNCMPAQCGDGFTWAGEEECDDGNEDDADACLGSCTAAACGDGIVWLGVETCDDRNEDDTDACPGTCMEAACGDGFVWAGEEECDDGNDDDTDGCTTTCTVDSSVDDTSTGEASTGDGTTGDGTTGPVDVTTGPVPGSSTEAQDESAGVPTSTGSGTGEPEPTAGTTGDLASTGETYGPFPGLDDDGGCTCVAARERGPKTVLAWLGVLALVLRRRRHRSGGRRGPA